MPERRFRDMRLTEGDVLRTVHFHWWTHVYVTQKSAAWRRGYTRFLERTQGLLPLWRQWAIERERLWFALIGLGLDIESDTRDMPRAEMRRRIENESKRSLQALFVLQEVNR